MKLRLPVAVAIIVGVLTLALTLAPRDTLPGNLNDLRLLLVEWAATLGAVALMVGVVNLSLVHLRRISNFSTGWVYSIFLVLAFLIVAGLGALSLIISDESVAETARLGTRFAFIYIQTPVESSLAALLLVVMVVAGARLIRARRNWAAVLFIIVTLVLIAGFAPMVGLEALGGARDWLMQVPAVGGARGILLGIALGTIATGLRVIIGTDHPYGE